MGGKTKATTTTNQTQTAAPPSWTAPGISDAAAAVTNAMNTAIANPNPYTGDFVAAYDPAKLAATQKAINDAAAAGKTATGQINSTQAFSADQMKALFQPRDLSTELNAAINASIAPVFRQLQEQTLPGIRDSAIQSGAYSNSRALGVVPQTAIRDATTSAEQIAAQLGYSGMQAEEDRRIQRAGLLPAYNNSVTGMATAGADINSKIAAMMQQGLTLDQAAAQALLDNKIAQHDYATTSPYEGIAPAVQLLSQLSGSYGTQTLDGTQTTVQKTSPGIGGIISGLGGLAMGIASGNPFGAASALSAVGKPMSLTGTSMV